MSDAPMKVRDVVGLSTRYLADHGSGSPRLDAEILTAMALGVRRLDLYLTPDRPLSEEERESLRDLVRRRGSGEPVAYITGRREFHGLTFLVSPAVLVPRPETEVLVDAAVAELGGSVAAPLVADVGTGSGAIACALAHTVPSAKVLGTDTSAEALGVARSNVARLGMADRVGLVRCDLLSGLDRAARLDAVVSNPPYVGEDEEDLLDPDVREYEPWEALFAGADGMTVTRRLVDEATAYLKPGGALLIEVGTPAQGGRARGLLEGHSAYSEVTELSDAAGVVRGLSARRS